jgi:hypothetical protein
MISFWTSVELLWFWSQKQTSGCEESTLSSGEFCERTCDLQDGNLKEAEEQSRHAHFDVEFWRKRKWCG